MSNKTTISELRMLFDASEGAWYVGREYYDERRQQWQVWGMATATHSHSKEECRDELRRLVIELHTGGLAEAAACGSYFALLEADHPLAVHAALTVEGGIRVFDAGEVAA